MPSRTRFYQPWLWSLPLVALSGTLVLAQPPSPLELVRGLREHGQVELAMEYLKDIEKKPLSTEDKAAIPLERAKCLLDASEAEPDEGTRLGMIAEAKEGLNGFLINHANHPRAVEALLAVAKLTAMDAKEQLNRARRMDIPPISEDPGESAARERAQDKQKTEAAKARPLFLLAAKRYGEASARLRTQLEDKSLDYLRRRALEREAFEADLANGINQFNTAETYMPASRITGAEKNERNKYLEQAKATFGKLAKGPQTNRTAWVARAWSAEVTFEQNDFNTAAAEVTAILRANVLEAEDGKRLARFFQLRRNFLTALGERNLQKVIAVQQELRDWKRLYDNPRKPTPEAFAVRYYLARVLESLAETNIGPRPKDGKPIVLSNTVQKQLAEAEKLFRTLGQTDNDFTQRATRHRMSVVRLLLGDADQPPSSYTTFENAQMASLIQLSKLAAEEAKPEDKQDEKKIKKYQHAAIAVLERARELATPADNPADVTDVLLRLIYFYRITDQPYQEAVLGDYVAHTIKSTGGKAALAGLLGINGYITASMRVKGDDPEMIKAARAADRERAMTLARFLDEKYPNDNATDSARHQLAALLVEDKKLLEAFEVITKIRTGYSQITNARLLEGYLASQLVTPRESTLPPAKKAEIFKRAITDLSKVAKPSAIADTNEVRGYLSARCRHASLLFAQGRADPSTEKSSPGYLQALTIADQVMKAIPSFDSMTKMEGGMKKLNLDGLEMFMLAQDAYGRAVYLKARALIDDGKLAEADKALSPLLTIVKTQGAVMTPQMKVWAMGRGELIDPAKPDTEDNRDKPAVAAHKARVAQLAGAVDKTRVEVILAGFRLKVKESKPAEAAELLDLMIKAGGTIEDNLPILELLSREMAVQMAVYKKEGKKAEADALGAGLAVLLKKIGAVPKLSPRMVLFLAQTLQAVGENEQAIEQGKKIQPPEFKDWDKKKPEEFPPELQGQIQNQIRDYAIAQLTLARAYRDAKKYPEAEALLTGIIGTNDKPGWGSGRLYFRRELAMLHEAKGHALKGNVKAANAQWGKALQEWTTLYRIHQARLRKLTKDISPEKVKEYHNAFADAFFDVQRCLVKANEDLLDAKIPSQATKLQKTYDDVGKKFADMEKVIKAGEWDPVVQNQYADFLKEVPKLLPAYQAAGGKLFLKRLPTP
jgi:hypothetical protein